MHAVLLTCDSSYVSVIHAFSFPLAHTKRVDPLDLLLCSCTMPGSALLAGHRAGVIKSGVT